MLPHVRNVNDLNIIMTAIFFLETQSLGIFRLLLRLVLEQFPRWTTSIDDFLFILRWFGQSARISHHWLRLRHLWFTSRDYVSINNLFRTLVINNDWQLIVIFLNRMKNRRVSPHISDLLLFVSFNFFAFNPQFKNILNMFLNGVEINTSLLSWKLVNEHASFA